MKIAVFLVRSGLSKSRVRTRPMIEYVGILFDNGRKCVFVDVSCGEIGLAEIRFLIIVIEGQLERFSDLIVFVIPR